jgi:hypothetical protein
MFRHDLRVGRRGVMRAVTASASRRAAPAAAQVLKVVPLMSERTNRGRRTMKLLKSFTIGAAMMAATLASPAMAQESSYKPGTVWEAGRIDVMPGQFENYMDWLATQWKKIQELGKAEGIVVEYHVLATNNPRAGEPDLILIVEYKDYQTTAQQEAFRKKVNAMMSQDNRAAAASGAERSKMREQLGSTEYQELVLK